MEEGYRIPARPSEAEFTEKRSRFIGQVWPVEDEGEARAYIAAVRKRFHDARHHCWCYRIREGGVERYSDDGEPQGTAGQPMLNVFQREAVTNACCVVTRYFGGILLGAGGLTRAYGTAAKMALDEAGVHEAQRWSLLSLSCPYALYERLRLLAENMEGVITDTAFAAAVTLTVTLPSRQWDDFSTRVTELSAGSVAPVKITEEFR